MLSHDLAYFAVRTKHELDSFMGEYSPKTQRIGSALEVSSFELTIGTYNVQKSKTCSEKSGRDSISLDDSSCIYDCNV